MPTTPQQCTIHSTTRKNASQEKFAKEIREIATSIKKEFGVEIKAKEFIAEFCNLFEKEIKNKGVVEI